MLQESLPHMDTDYRPSDLGVCVSVSECTSVTAIMCAGICMWKLSRLQGSQCVMITLGLVQRLCWETGAEDSLKRYDLRKRRSIREQSVHQSPTGTYYQPISTTQTHVLRRSDRKTQSDAFAASLSILSPFHLNNLFPTCLPVWESVITMGGWKKKKQWLQAFLI